MNFSKQFASFIKNQLKEEEHSVSYLARKVGVSRGHMYDLLFNRKRWNQDLIDRVCESLKIEIIFKKAS